VIAPFFVAPLADKHDRTKFTSGVAELDRYFQFQAGQDAKRKVAAPFVLLDQREFVVGYYTLSAYGIRLTDLPAETVKRLPKYPLLPATLLGRLAVNREHHGQKLGQFLLMDALRRSLKNTGEIGSIGVVVDAFDASAERFYSHHEFTAFGHSGKLFLSMATIKRLFPE
jgi:predicted GNAT family N-acyltransferase